MQTTSLASGAASRSPQPSGAVFRTPELDNALGHSNDVVISLLRDSLAIFDRDQDQARTRLARAYALLTTSGSGGERKSAPETTQGGLAPWQIRRVSAHIDGRLDSSLPTAELAAVTRLSTGYFARAFKRSFGTTPHTYIFQRRIQRAQEMMLTTSEGLSQIALACGFADQAHFTRRFRLATDASPHAWRRERLAEPRLIAA